MTSAALLTVLFTDLVGSTELLTAGGGGTRVLTRHLAGLRRVVEEHGGTPVKATGDGVMATFASASAGLSCAVALQQHVCAELRDAPSLRMRVGVSAGDVAVETADVFGTPVVEAARLCDTASPGEILVADLVCRLAGSRDVSMVPLGALDLKGLGPVDASRVAWEPPAPPAPTLPAVLAASRRGPFVGRDAELDALRLAWKRTVAGALQLAVLSGEAGIGKSRLAAELATAAGSEGAVVVAGRCDEDGADPYQPFPAALRQLLVTLPADEIPRRLGPRAVDLARLLPEVADVVDVDDPPRFDAPVERRLACDAAVRLVRAVASASPVLLVLEDVHLAGDAAVALLRSLVADERESAPVLVVVTVRSTELDPASPAAALLGEWRGDPRVERLDLTPLDEPSVDQFLRAIGRGDPGLAALLHERTGGNALFLTELATSGTDVPDGIREAVARRLARLTPDAREVLSLAAVAGPSSDLSLLEAATGWGDGDRVLDALDAAVKADVLTELGLGVYAFRHELVRDALRATLTATRIARLHRRVADAIESLPGADEAAASIARHLAAGSPPDPRRAARWALAAAERALEGPRHDEGVAHASAGLDLLGDEDPALRSSLHLQLAVARRRVLDIEGARQAAVAAGDLAIAAGDQRALARAAAEYLHTRGSTDAPDPALREFCERALASCDDDLLRAAVLGGLAFYEATAEHERDAAERHAREAVALARRTGDPDVLARNLGTLSVSLLGTARVEERLAAANEAAELQRGYLGYDLRGPARLELADRDGFEEDAAHLREIGSQRGDGFAQAMATSFDVVSCLLDGRWDDARAGVDALAGFASHNPSFTHLWAGQTFVLARETGTLAELAPVLEDMAWSSPNLPAFRVALVLALAETGDPALARREFAALAADRFAAVPRDVAWTMSLAMLSEAAAALGLTPSEGVGDLYDLLAPHEHHTVVTGWGVACLGAVDHHLGRLAALLGRSGEASTRLGRAVQVADALRSPPLRERAVAARKKNLFY